MLKRSFFILLTAAFFSFLAVLPSGCYYDNEEDLYAGGTGACDTVSVSYSADIQPILAANCYECHSDGSNVAGFTFDAHAELKNYADGGSLVARINDASNPMPPSGLLSSCDREKIEAWVKAGAANN